LLVAVVGLAFWSAWSGGVTRDRYERIRTGMTRAEVTEIMAHRPMTPTEFGTFQIGPEPSRKGVRWKLAAREGTGDLGDYETFGFDGPIGIFVFYRDDKTIGKIMLVHVMPWDKIIGQCRHWLGL
jgi:hypothetical protein